MFAFVSLAHAVYNAGLMTPWEVNQRELRHFVSVAEWVKRIESAGFRDTGARVLQAHDPTDNTPDAAFAQSMDDGAVVLGSFVTELPNGVSGSVKAGFVTAGDDP